MTPLHDLTHKRKFGSVALKLIERIESAKFLHVLFLPTSWVTAAAMLPPFNGKATTEEKNKWMAVVKQILEDDFRGPEQAESYCRLITAPSHQTRWKAVFINKIEGEFDSLWGLHRKPKG